MLNYRIVALATMVLALTAIVSVAAFLQRPDSIPPVSGSEETSPKVIVVSGEATVYAEPDMAYVQLGVQTTAPTAQEAQQKNADQMAAVIDKVLNLGIDRKDIRTSGINLYPISERRDGRPLTPTGYQASNQVNVTVRDLKKVATVLDTAVAAGANTTGGVGFGFQDDSSLRREALAKAVESAKPKAESVAKALGVRISGARSVVEEGVSVPRALESMRAMPSTGMGDATPVMPGQLTVVARVSVTYSY